ncbi:hypothetical protein [Galbibacter sp.]|uniref:hypothetical protein n=1 Tax=Galbibacter sp. TaxID=2918471 RepID=UPI003A8D84DE
MKTSLNKEVNSFIVIASLLVSLTINSQNDPSDEIKPLPRDLEIQLALSALPPHLRDSATVHTLKLDKGFEITRNGSNGFHAFVARTGEDAMRGSWPLTSFRNDILYPISFDQAGAESQMQVFLDIAAMQANGVPPQQVKLTIQHRYKTHSYKAPKQAGISYMLSPILRTYVNPDKNPEVNTLSIPHVMYFAPHIKNEDIGGSKPGGTYPFVILHGAHGYMVQLLGERERKLVKTHYKEMLERLCQINSKWCLPKP